MNIINIMMKSVNNLPRPNSKFLLAQRQRYLTGGKRLETLSKTITLYNPQPLTAPQLPGMEAMLLMGIPVQSLELDGLSDKDT